MYLLYIERPWSTERSPVPRMVSDATEKIPRCLELKRAYEISAKTAAHTHIIEQSPHQKIEGLTGCENYTPKRKVDIPERKAEWAPVEGTTA